jgi:hypothetical protein
MPAIKIRETRRKGLRRHEADEDEKMEIVSHGYPLLDRLRSLRHGGGTQVQSNGS